MLVHLGQTVIVRSRSRRPGEVKDTIIERVGFINEVRGGVVAVTQLARGFSDQSLNGPELAIVHVPATNTDQHAIWLDFASQPIELPDSVYTYKAKVLPGGNMTILDRVGVQDVTVVGNEANPVTVAKPAKTVRAK